MIRQYVNVQTCHYYNNPGHIKKVHCKKNYDEKSRVNYTLSILTIKRNNSPWIKWQKKKPKISTNKYYTTNYVLQEKSDKCNSKTVIMESSATSHILN